MLREELGDESFTQASSQGRTMSLQSAVALALEPVSSAERDETSLVEP